MNQQNAKKYEDQFNSDFAEYEKMKPAIDQVCAVFDSLEKDMRRCKEGTKEFKEIYKSAMNEYKRQVQKGIQSSKWTVMIRVVLASYEPYFPLDPRTQNIQAQCGMFIYYHTRNKRSFLNFRTVYF